MTTPPKRQQDFEQHRQEALKEIRAARAQGDDQLVRKLKLRHHGLLYGMSGETFLKNLKETD